MGVETEYDDGAISQRNAQQGNQVIQIDSGKHIHVVALCTALCSVAACVAIWSAYTATRAERETRMLEYYVNEVDGKLIHAGFIEPRERWSPEKRKEYEEKKP